MDIGTIRIPAQKPVPLPRQAGLTLIEVMIALFVMAALLAGSVTTARQSQRLLHTSQEVVVATTLLNKKIEELRAAPYDVVLGLAGDVSANSGTVADEGIPGISFQWARTFSATTSADLLEVTVSVTWDDFGRTRSLKSITYVARYGVGNKETRFES